MFDPDKLKRSLETSWLGHEFLYFEELDSTNSHLKKLDLEKVSHGLVCLADNQKRGRGQYERNWESHPGKNLTFTIALKPPNPDRLHVLTLACALAITKVVEELTGIPAEIHWPNDIVINCRKLGGLLTESVFSGNKLDRVLMGIGLNVNQEGFSESLRETATSLSIETGDPFTREEVLSDLLSRIEHEYTRWNKRERDLLKSINRKIAGYGKWVGLVVNGKERNGKWKLLGVNEQGEVVVINEEAEAESFFYEQIRLITD